MSNKFIIKGNNKLSGEISVSGAKNAALKFFAASLLFKKPVILHNVPNISEIKLISELIESLGGAVEKLDKHSYKINCKDVNSSNIPCVVANKFRSSILTLGPLLSRFKKASFPSPGGCAIGRRPIDLFLEGFKSFRIDILETPELYQLTTNKLIGSKFVFPWISHTVTESLILTAVFAEGKTTIINAASEPEVVSLCDFLNKAGAKIKGAGTSTITIEGIDTDLKSIEYSIIPDRIEASTFMIMGALIGKKIIIKDCNTSHMDVFLKVMNQAGIKFTYDEKSIEISKAKNIKPTNIRTHEYPGLSTDCQPPFTLLMTQAKGNSLIHETIFEGRLFFIDLLNKMGANITMCDPHRAIVHGPTKFFGQKLASPDLRAGITLLLASLIAEGTSEIDNILQIDRGYESIDKRLKNLGADIKRV